MTESAREAPILHPPLTDRLTPDVALRLTDPRPGQPPCLSDENQAALLAAIREQLREPFPDAEVEPVCTPDSLRVGIWVSPQRSDAERAARLARLRTLDLVLNAPLELVSFLVRAAFLRHQAALAFAAAPKRYDNDGNPDPDGPVELLSIAVDFPRGNQVVTTVRGRHRAALAAVPFSIRLTDTLTPAGAGRAGVAVSTSVDVEVDEPPLLSFLITIALNLLLPIAGFFLSLVRALTIVGLNGSAGPDTLAGAGAAAAAFLPAEVPLPGGVKLVLGYDRVDVDSTGVTAAATALGGGPVPRQPSVRIETPLANGLIVTPGHNPPPVRFSIVPTDLRPDLTIAWSAGPGDVITSPAAPTTNIRFTTADLPDNTQVVREVAVVVTDADGLTAQDRHRVPILVTDHLPQPLPLPLPGPVPQR
jgi:hypothetical protein